ncbi:hypothetical protein ACIG56_33385 [Nocardia fusca]|uniref:hypothetical protein n=1 Tax=Nocardia fusca TaxID=941183 RepID=UPI0037CB0F8F
MTYLGVKFWVTALGIIAAALVAAAPASAQGLPVTPAPTSATEVGDPPPCINYPGNIPCNLSTLSASINPF